MELMEEIWDSDEGGAGWKCLGGKKGVRQTNGHKTGGKRVDIKHSKRVCSTG